MKHPDLRPASWVGPTYPVQGAQIGQALATDHGRQRLRGERGVAFVEMGVTVAAIAIAVIAAVIYFRDRAADRYCGIGGKGTGDLNAQIYWNPATKKCEASVDCAPFCAS